MSPPDAPAPRRSPRAGDADPPCSMPGCGATSVRSLALAEARKGFSELPESGGRAHLCREHYRTWKKKTKKERELQRLGW